MDVSDERPLLHENQPVNNYRDAPRVSNRNLYLSCGAMLFGSLSLGFTLGMSSPMIPDMENDTSSSALDMTTSDYSWFGSLITLGAMVGGVLGGGFIQTFGRKLTAMLCGVPFVGGMLLMAYSTDVVMLLVGRTLTGFASGVASLAVPTYISETSTQHLRGLLGSANQLFITFGILFVYALGVYLPWRWLAIAGAVPCTLLTVCVAFIPETPRYLLIKHRRREARKSLQILRGKSADVAEELEGLEDAIASSARSVPWSDLLRERTIRTPLLLSLGVMFFQQASGINCIMFFSATIFGDAGFTGTMLNVALIIIAGLQVIFTGISCFIMDKAGRKILLMISGAVMAITTGTFGLYFQLTSSSGNGTEPQPGDGFETDVDASGANNLTWLALVSIMGYMSAFAIGLGPVPWLLLSEIIPVQARGKASGLSTGVNWFLAFIFTKEFHDMQVAFTVQGTFWIYSGICLIGVFYHGILLPETKGKTLEEISAHFGRNTHVERFENDDSADAQ